MLTPMPNIKRFKAHLEDELYNLYRDLRGGSYKHGSYIRSIVHEPKRRIIHAAGVRDRVVHRMLYNYLLPIFDPRWLACSFSCRPGFGQHTSVDRVAPALRQATYNYNRVCVAIKCDVKKFFDHINHEILFRLLCRRVRSAPFQLLLWQVIDSFCAGAKDRGVPIGNLTSQIFANVYLHELDCYAKRAIKVGGYFRYADDILIIALDAKEARRRVEELGQFLHTRLRLELHPDKTIMRKSYWGIDWLGQVLLPGYRVLRPVTRRRMMKRIDEGVAYAENSEKVRGMLASYHGLMKPTAHRRLQEIIMQKVALRRDIWYRKSGKFKEHALE